MSTLNNGSSLQGGKYVIEKVLGQGGFGITYLANQPMLDRKVAIKEFFFKEHCERDETTSYVTLGSKANQEQVKRFLTKFLKEAKTISKFNQANIVLIHDIFEENGTAYYVMEYIEGESLAAMVKRRGAIPQEEALAYIKDVAKALSYIHAKNINHLDIKPSNIMKRKEDGRILLIDFGVSKQYDAETNEGTTTTPVGVSHGYSPTEQYRKNGVQSFSPQSDVYSLAATLYCLLTGKRPPEAMDVQDEGLPLAPLKAKGISQNVINSIANAMKSRKSRTQSIELFVNDLENKNTIQRQSALDDEEDEDATVVRDGVKPVSKKVTTPAQVTTPPPTTSTPTGDTTVVKGKKKSSMPYIYIAVAVCVILGAIIAFTGKGKDKGKQEDYTEVKDYPIYGANGAVIFKWSGTIKNNLPDGKGVAKYDSSDPDGRKDYKGDYVNGIRTSKNATLTYTNGDIYEGSFDDDKFVEGKLTLKEAQMYFKGKFKENQPYEGNWFFMDGTVYTKVKNGKEQGQ